MEQNTSDTGEQASLTRSTVRGVFWVTATRVLKVPLNLITLAVLARLLTPADFGIIAIALLVKTLADVLVDGSFGMVLIQRRSIDSALIGASLVLSIALAALFAGALTLTAPYIQQAFDFPQLSDVLLVVAIVLPLSAITTITTSLLQRAFRFRRLTLNGFVAQLTYTVVAVALAFAGMGLWSLVWGQLASVVVDAMMGYIAVRKEYRVGFSGTAFRDVLGSGGMFTFSKLLGWAASSIDRLVVGRFLGATELGFYSRSAALMTATRQVTGAGPVRVLFSAFSKIQDDQPRMRSGYLRALWITVVLSAFVSSFFIVNAEVIVRILLGPQWTPAVPLIQILFTAYVARSGYVVAESVPLALGLSRASAIRQGAQFILVLTGGMIGAQFGVVGAAIGVAIARWLFYLLCLLLVRRLLDVGWPEVIRVHANGILLTAGPVLLALAVQWFLPGENLLVQLVPGVLFVVAALIVLSFAPAALVGDDILRGRARIRQFVSPRLARMRTGL